MKKPQKFPKRCFQFHFGYFAPKNLQSKLSLSQSPASHWASPTLLLRNVWSNLLLKPTVFILLRYFFCKMLKIIGLHTKIIIFTAFLFTDRSEHKYLTLYVIIISEPKICSFMERVDYWSWNPIFATSLNYFWLHVFIEYKFSSFWPHFLDLVCLMYCLLSWTYIFLYLLSILCKHFRISLMSWNFMINKL